MWVWVHFGFCKDANLTTNMVQVSNSDIPVCRMFAAILWCKFSLTVVKTPCCLIESIWKMLNKYVSLPKTLYKLTVSGSQKKGGSPRRRNARACVMALFSFWKKLGVLFAYLFVVFFLTFLHSWSYRKSLSLFFCTVPLTYKSCKKLNKHSPWCFLVLDCLYRPAFGFLVCKLGWIHSPGLWAYLKMFAVESSVFTFCTFWLKYRSL